MPLFLYIEQSCCNFREMEARRSGVRNRPIHTDRCLLTAKVTVNATHQCEKGSKLHGAERWCDNFRHRPANCIKCDNASEMSLSNKFCSILVSFQSLKIRNISQAHKGTLAQINVQYEIFRQMNFLVRTNENPKISRETPFALWLTVEVLKWSPWKGSQFVKPAHDKVLELKCPPAPLSSCCTP